MQTILKEKRPPLLDKSARPLLLPVLVYALGNMALDLYHDVGAQSFDMALPFLLLPFGLWALRRFAPAPQWWWRGLALGAIAAAGIASYQYLDTGQRARGFAQEIQFGNIALLMGLLCLARALLQPHGSRILMWLGIRRWHWQRRLLLIAPLLGVIAGAILLPASPVHKRIQDTLAEWHLATDDFSKPQPTSFGMRLQMWQYALAEIPQHPWIGVGERGWEQGREQAIAQGRLLPDVRAFNQVHNEYLDRPLKKGLIGLTLFLCLLLLPLLLFFRPALRHADPEVRSFAASGVLISLLYIVACATQSFTGHNSGRMVLASFLCAVGALMLNAQAQSATASTAPGKTGGQA